MCCASATDGNLLCQTLEGKSQQDQCLQPLLCVLSAQLQGAGLFLPLLRANEPPKPGNYPQWIVIGHLKLMLRISHHAKILLLSGALGLGALQVANAQDTAVAPKDDKTVAIVNGHEIKISEVQMATDDIIGQLPDLPPKLRYPFVVEFLIERHMLAQLAVKDGIADTDEYKRRLALYQAKALRDAYFFQKIRPQVTEEQIKAAYDEESKKVAQTERVRARHILVGTEQEAKDIEAKLQAGEKFDDLAKKYSIDGSKDYGGDLGYFTAPEMVADFSKAAFALKAGEISPPVKTDFGWHVIKLEDRKLGAAQPYDQVKGAIRNVLLRKKVQETMETLRSTAKVEVLDEDLKKYAADVAKKRKAILDQQNQQAVDPAAQSEPEGGGKGDLQAPQ
jgi:peptidyl-prolyl cis-trans isomerase C